jgi:hypothetical protein
MLLLERHSTIPTFELGVGTHDINMSDDSMRDDQRTEMMMDLRGEGEEPLESRNFQDLLPHFTSFLTKKTDVIHTSSGQTGVRPDTTTSMCVCACVCVCLCELKPNPIYYTYHRAPASSTPGKRGKSPRPSRPPVTPHDCPSPRVHRPGINPPDLP